MAHGAYSAAEHQELADEVGHLNAVYGYQEGEVLDEAAQVTFHPDNLVALQPLEKPLPEALAQLFEQLYGFSSLVGEAHEHRASVSLPRLLRDQPLTLHRAQHAADALNAHDLLLGELADGGGLATTLERTDEHPTGRREPVRVREPVAQPHHEMVEAEECVDERRARFRIIAPIIMQTNSWYINPRSRV